MATDYLLGVLCVIFARRLWHANRLWAPAFAFSAAASLLGGTVHGFAVAWLWKPMVYSVAMPSFFFLFPSLRVVAWAKLVVYASWAIVRDEFKYVRRAAEATT